MCGIFWIHKKNLEILSSEKEYFSHIQHRGEINSYIQEEDLYIGYTRLPTDDIYNNSLDYPKDFFYNGIITNVEDLHWLFNLCEISKSSDTMTLREWFQKYKWDFLCHVRWMYAFACLESTNIYLVRDTIGIKPMYYWVKDGVFAFASESKALLFCDTIYELLPGEILKYQRKEWIYTITNFQYTSYKNYAANQNDLIKCFQESYIKSTKRYISHWKKVALLLSWWIDSVLLYQLLHVYAPEICDSINIYVLATDNSDDKKKALEYSKYLQKNLQIVNLDSAEKSYSDLEKIVYIMDSPIPRVVKVWLLQKKLAERIKQDGIDVVISWEWADELFFGYKRFYKDKSAGESERLFYNFFKNIFFHTLLQRLDRAFSYHTIEARVPFLDQELIEIAKKYSFSQKVGVYWSTFTQKIPLRMLWKHLWVPESLFMREKVKMTLWVTSKKNTQKDIHWYLEKEIFEHTAWNSKDYFEKLFFKNYYRNRRNIFYHYNTFQQEKDY